MKNLFLFAFAAILLFSCKKEVQPICEISNPLEDIAWLKTMHETFQKRASPVGAQIIQYEYNGECVFLIEDCHQCPDAMIVVYNENQDVICEFGGFAGVDTCPDFDEKATNEIVLYDGIE